MLRADYKLVTTYTYELVEITLEAGPPPLKRQKKPK
jgi:hypothetical protein